jgi:hypothetical protein
MMLGLIFAAAEPFVGGPEGYIFVARLLLRSPTWTSKIGQP